MSCSISSSSSSGSSTSARISIGDTATTEVLLRQEEQVIDLFPTLLSGDKPTTTNTEGSQTKKENLSTPAVVDLSSPSDQGKQSAPIANNNPEPSYSTDDSLFDCLDIIDISPPASTHTPKHPQEQQPQKQPTVTFVQRAVYSAHQQGILDDLAAQQGLASRLDAFRCNDGASCLGGRPVLRVSNGDSDPARENTARRRKSSVQSKFASAQSEENMEVITSVTRKSIIRPRPTPNVRSLSSLPRTSRSITAHNIALSTASATPGTTPEPAAPAPGTRLSKSERDAHTLRLRLASLPCPQDAIAKMRALRLMFPRSGCCEAAAREMMCESEMLRLFDAGCRRDEAGAVEVVNSMSFISLRLDGSACEDEHAGGNAIEVPRTPSPEPKTEEKEMLETEGWRDEDDSKTVPSSQPSQPSQQGSPLLIPPCEEIPPQIINALALSSPSLSSDSVIVLSDNAEYDCCAVRTDAKYTYEAEISDSESEGAYTSDVDANFLLSSSPFPQRRSISPAAAAAPPKRSIFASSSPLRAPSSPVLRYEREFHSSRAAAEAPADFDDSIVNESSPRKSKTKRRKKSVESSESGSRSKSPPPPFASAGEGDEETKRLLGLPAAELRAKLNAWGLKAPRKKVDMVDLIVEYSSRLMGTGAQPPPPAVSQVDLEISTETTEQPQTKKDETSAASVMTSTEIRSAIMNRISIHVRTAETARAWWLKILKYEPIVVEEFAEYLVRAGVLVAAARGGRDGDGEEEVGEGVVLATKEWCDSRCVCTISKTGPGQARVKKKAKKARR